MQVTTDLIVEALVAVESTIVARYGRKVARLGKRVDINDLIQIVSLRAIEHGKSCQAKSESELRHWVLTIAGNVYRSLVTTHMGLAKRSMRSEGCVIGVSQDGEGEGYQPAGRFVEPSVAIETREECEHIMRAIDGLNDLQAKVVRMKFIEQMDNAEIASELGCTVQAVKSVSSRALGVLRQAMAV